MHLERMPRPQTEVHGRTAAALCLLLVLTALPASQLGAALRADDAAVRADGNHARSLSALRFVENRGQFGREGLLADARYLVWGSGVYAFLSPTSITYVFTRADVAQAPISEASGAPLRGDTEVDRLLDRLRRTTLAHDHLTVRFEGARTDAVLAAASAPTAHFNYYLARAPEGITNVPAHDALVVRDLYPGIDLVYDVASGMLKTSFVVHPGADPARIRMTYAGGSTAIVDGALSSVTGLGFLKESAPVCFELTAPMLATGDGFPDIDALRTAPAGGTRPASSYHMHDGAVGFTVGPHDASRALVIDPQILWGTYYGGTSSEVGNDVAMSPTGPIVAGMTTSTTGIATAGTYQTVFTGPSSDAFVAQFDAAGTLVWGTYFGGASYEGAKSVARDASGLIGFTGFTASTSGVASTGAWQTAYAGGPQDAFVALFSASGGRIWSTYLGGSGYEDGNGIAFDSQGNVVVTGWTSSTAGIATAGTHQSAMAGGDDAFIATFTPAGARRWGTYLGGSGSDWGEGVAVDRYDNIVVVGRTNSASGIAVPMVQQPSYGGGPFYGDGYVAMFDGTGARTWASYIGGPGDDWATDVAMTSDNDIVVTGYTESATFIASRGVHQETLGGGEDAFVVQYAPWGVRRWGSYVGGSGQDRGRGVATVDSSYVMITGFTKSPNVIATPGAYQNGYNGGLEGDAFIVELTTTGVRVCGTYYGGPGSDVGLKIATDALGYMYATGYTESMTGMATTGSWKDVYGGMQDVFLGRFDLCLKSEVTSITIDAVAPGPYCAGDSLLIPFTVRGTFAAGNVFTAYLSDASGGFSAPAFLGQLQGTTSGVIRCTIPIDVPTGTGYRVMIVSSSPYQQSPPNDRSITIYFKPIAEITPQQTVFLCPGRSITLRANTGAGLTYAWYSSESPNPIGTGSTLVVDRTASYVVRVTSPNGCSTLSLPTQVSVGLPPARAGDDRTICTGASTVLGDPLPGGQSFYRYAWTPTAGLNDPTIAKPTASPTRTTVYYLTQTDTSGCTGIDSVRVTVNPPIVFDLGPDLTLCQGESLQLRPDITSGLGPYEIIWSPTIGLSSPKDLNPRAAPLVNTTYVLTLRDGAGCVGSDTVFIRVFPVTPPTVLAEGPTTFCKGDSVRLTAEAGYDAYSWSTGDTTRSAVVRVTGNHYVTVTDRNGCRVPSRAVFVNAIEPEIPKITVWPSGTICAGDSAVLTVEGVHRAYRWSGGQRTRSIVVRAAGTYSVSVLDTNGCTAGSVPVSIFVTPVPTPRASGPLTVCRNSRQLYTADAASPVTRTWRAVGGSVVAGQGTAAATIAWGSGDSGLVILSERFPTFSCESHDTLHIVIDTTFSPTVLTSGPRTFCDGDSIVLSLGPNIRSALWSTGDTTLTLVVRTSGRYSVIATDDGGCTGRSDPVDILVQPVPRAAITGDTLLCAGDLAAYTTVAPPGTSLHWSSTTGAIAGDSTAARVDIRWSAGGRDTLRLTVRDDVTGCASTSLLPLRISAIATPRIIASQVSPICRDDEVVLRAEPAGLLWLWSTGATADSIVVRNAGTYTLEARNADGCTATAAPFTLDIVDPPTAAIAGPRATCTGAISTFTTSVPVGDALRWSVSGGIVRSPLDESVLRVEWSASGSFLIVLEVERGPCRVHDTLRMTVSDRLVPVVMLSDTSTFCLGDSVMLTAAAGYPLYRWSTGETTRSITVRSSGSYSVFVDDGAGCTGTSAPVVVTVHAPAQPVITGPTSFCAGDTVTLSLGGATGAILWSTGETTRSVRIAASAIVSVTVVDANGCSATSADHVMVMHPLPAVPVVTRTGPTLTSTPATAYQWYRDEQLLPGATGRVLGGGTAGLYRVRITDANGCTALSDTIGIPEAEEATALVELPMLVAAPGDIIRMPVVLASTRNLDQALPTEVNARIVFDAGTLVPVPPTPTGIVRNGERVIDVRGAYAWPQDTLFTLLLRATLGAVQFTPVRIESMDWGSTMVRTTTSDGGVTLVICEEGGARLFDASGRVTLRQNHPNPFNATTVIEYETIEDGPVQLRIVDAAARTVAVLVDGERAAGAYRVTFDAGQLASGTYLAVLQTASVVKTTVMLLAK